VNYLTLMRHASASNETSLYRDIDRPLSRNGIEEAITTAKSIGSRNPKPSKIVSSSATRTEQTAEIIINENNWKSVVLESEPELYLASCNSLINKINQLSVTLEHIMVVSHNPGLSDLVEYLLPHLKITMPTCSYLTVQFSTGVTDLNFEFEIKDYSYSENTDTN